MKGALEQMVKVDNLLLNSNETEDGPPSMELDSSKPLLEITGKASLLGITPIHCCALQRIKSFVRTFKADRRLSLHTELHVQRPP